MRQKSARCIFLEKQHLITNTNLIEPTPWDELVFDFPTWEVKQYSIEALELTLRNKGHFTIKVGPLENKRLLSEFGFYYCDTLIEPFCTKERLRVFDSPPEISISKDFDVKNILHIANGAFVHGRFHRDFNLSRNLSDKRYINWLDELIKKKQVYGFFWNKQLAGFVGLNKNNLVLHAIDQQFRGKGLSKFWWSEVCKDILSEEFTEVKSSISVTNVAVLNLYSSLGFSFSNPIDVYHLFKS